MEYFVVYAADNASLIVLRDLLVNGKSRRRWKCLGWISIGNRDIYGNGGSFVRRVRDQVESSKRTGQVTALHPHLADMCMAPFRSCISQPCTKIDGSNI